MIGNKSLTKRKNSPRSNFYSYRVLVREIFIYFFSCRTNMREKKRGTISWHVTVNNYFHNIGPWVLP
jgi:hypothetical protein